MEGEVSTFIGIDIGGTNCKVAVLSQTPIQGIRTNSDLEININNKKYHLFYYSTLRNTDFFHYLKQLKTSIKGNFKVGGTGGGSTSLRHTIQEIFGQTLHLLNEFDAHGKGLQFHKKAQLITLIEHFSKKGNDIKATRIQTSLHDYSDMLFMSFGSGVNFQLYGDSENGFERKPAKDKALTAGDGYFLEGTSLGAGFLKGLCRLKTQQPNFNVLLKIMKQEDSNLNCYYSTVLTNLFLMAINMSLLHQQPNLVISGALLSFDVDISTLFSQALLYVHSRSDIQITVIRLERLEGFLGALGALEMVLNSV